MILPIPCDPFSRFGGAAKKSALRENVWVKDKEIQPLNGRVCECGHEILEKVAEMFGCRGLRVYLSELMKKGQPFDLRL